MPRLWRQQYRERRRGPDVARAQSRSSTLTIPPLAAVFLVPEGYMRLSGGTPHPLGATWDGRGTNFALFSANAEKVELCLFDSQGRRELERIALPERTEEVWHGYLSDVFPDSSMAIASMALTNRSAAIASTPTSCWSILMPSAWPGG